MSYATLINLYKSIFYGFSKNINEWFNIKTSESKRKSELITSLLHLLIYLLVDKDAWIIRKNLNNNTH